MSLHRIVACAALLAAAPLVVSSTTACATQPATHADAATQPEAVYTPVVVRPLGNPPIAVPGTDGRYHVVYELELTNTRLAPATLKQIDVVDASTPSRIIASYAGKALLDSLRTLQPAPAADAIIPANSSRLFYVGLAFPDAGAIPHALAHHLALLGSAANAGPHTPATAMDYTVARVEPRRAPLPIIEPPLRGTGWVALNGCCESSGSHRGAFISINGGMYDAQRFAIDWMRLNKNRELVHGDPSVVTNYTSYGEKVYAVADGTVVVALDDLDDQIPGKSPDPATITLRNIDGNHVILDIGHGLYAFYAHLKKGSITVHPGEHVKLGTVIGELGNTGQTGGPHLHFHLMDSPSLGAQGVPYVFNHFTLTGQVDVQKLEDENALTGHWGEPLAKPVAEKERFPLDLNIVDFTAH